MKVKSYTVSALNNYIKKNFDNDFILSNIYIKGEISNFKKHSSGHLYFSLVDEFSKINCVMFKDAASSILFEPKDGMNVEIRGKVSVYAKDGSYQLYCNEFYQAGYGELYLKFINLKEKLNSIGLFDIDKKKKVPKYPSKVGIITSPTGAALRDIINVAKRRNKYVEIVIYPALTQGEAAAATIIQGIEALNSLKDIDTIIIARGGGSFEELAVFNDEDLAYSISKSKTPIVTGIGHETDYTIADFVSDLRAPTPSAAAEVVIPSHSEISKSLKSFYDRLNSNIHITLLNNKAKIQLIKRTIENNNPSHILINQYNYIDLLVEKLNNLINLKVNGELAKIHSINQLLKSNSPLEILNKGYTIITDEDNSIISSVKQLKTINEVEIHFKDGKVKATLEIH